MSQTTIALAVLLSALLHAAWNALVKRTGDPRTASVAVLALSMAGASIIVVFRGGTLGDGIMATVAAGLCEAGYFATLGRALERAPLGPSYAVARGGALILAWPGAMLAFGDRPTVTSLAGATIVTVGIVFMGLGERASRSQRHGGLGWASATAAFIAGYTLFYKAAVERGAEPLTLFAASLAVAVPAALFELRRDGRRKLLMMVRDSIGPLMVAATICCASFWIFLVCLRFGKAGDMLTLRNSSVLFAMAFSAWLGVRPTRGQAIGAIAIACGAALLTR